MSLSEFNRKCGMLGLGMSLLEFNREANNSGFCDCNRSRYNSVYPLADV